MPWHIDCLSQEEDKGQRPISKEAAMRSSFSHEVMFFVLGGSLLLFGLTRTTPGQTHYCSSTLSKAKGFRNLQLNINEADVRALFTQSSRYRDSGIFNDGIDGLFLWLAGRKSDPTTDLTAAEPGKFPGISSIHFGFSQGRVRHIAIYFEQGAMPSNALALGRTVSKAMGLPMAWLGPEHSAFMQCQGFRVRVEGHDENKLAFLTIGSSDNDWQFSRDRFLGITSEQ